MQLLILFVGVLVMIQSSFSATLIDCDTLYSQRGIHSLQAAKCYQELLKTSEGSLPEKKELYTRAFIALSAVINDLPKTASERQAIDRGLLLLKDFSAEYSKSAELYYWNACMVSFDVFEKDRGAIIPTNTFGALGSIQNDLKTAIGKDPSIHFSGPLRVMGLMHTQMPAIVGGDKVFAEKMLKEAFIKSPQVSMNHLAYAKILEINGKTELAISILKKLIQTPDENFNPFPKEPLLNLLPEVIKDKKEAAALLKDITE